MSPAIRPLKHVLSPPGAAAVLVLGFIGVTLWWLGADSRVPDFDNGKHLNIAFLYYDHWQFEQWRGPFLDFTSYPPFVHLIGALGALVGGLGVAAPIVAQNLFFVPLLALGCYLAGRAASGSGLGGLLAVVFALGTPIVASQFHVFMLDAPQAALVAACVGLLLASRRLESVPLSAAAGLAGGLGMLSKQTTPLFVVGLVVVLLARGGWRNWRGLAVFLGVWAVVALPWYIQHYNDLQGLAEGATTLAPQPSSGPAPPVDPDSPAPPRWAARNFSWYLWALLNHQILLPLALFVAAGTVVSIVGFVRRRAPDDDLTPELVIGLLSAWAAMTLVVTFHDVRYTISLLVFLAVLGTRWIAQSPPRVRVPAAVALAVVALANFVIVSFGIDEPRRIDLPNAPPSGLHVRQLTLWSPEGYIVGGPEKGGDVPGIMRAARAQGILQIGFEPDIRPFFNTTGLIVLSREAGFPIGPQADPAKLDPKGAFIFIRPIGGIYSHPCTRFSPTEGVFYARAQGTTNFTKWKLSCPLRRRP